MTPIRQVRKTQHEQIRRHRAPMARDFYGMPANAFFGVAEPEAVEVSGVEGRPGEGDG
jgi:hypothetical protein